MMKPGVSEELRSPRARRLRGLLAGGAALLAVAYPLGWLLSLSHAAFSGCWLSCGAEPRPISGFAYAIFAGLALGAPFVVALRVAGSRSLLIWITVITAVVVVIAAWVMFSRNPANADFFVSLARDPLVLR